MKRIFFWLLSLISFVWAQEQDPAALPPQLQIVEKNQDEQWLSLRYTINHDGMVEVKLFDKKNRLLWQDQSVKVAGEHPFRLNIARIKKRLGAGTYFLELRYKGKRYPITLNIK